MFDVMNLWSERSKKTVKELSRYLRYIFNGHLMIVLLFLIGSVTFYYQSWVKTLDEQFPAGLIMSLILSVFLTYSPIYTFLLEADRVFLLPLENKLKHYFWKSGMVSFILQAYMLIMVLAALMPIYVQVSRASYKNFFYFLLILLLLKIWNLSTRWRIQYFVEKNVQFTDSFVRYCINSVFLYLIFNSANSILLVILGLVMLGMFYYFYKNSSKKGLKWEEIILLEQNRLTGFYRIANLFTDVPKLKDVVKRRKWLDWLAYRIVYQQENSQQYLLMRTFLRSGDYLGLVIRLTVIGCLLIYFWDFVYGKFLFLLLFMYLTGFQLLPLKNHHQNLLWIDLYPIQENQREKAFQKILSTVLLIQGCLFGLVFLIKGDWLFFLVGVIVAVIFTLLFVRFYSLKKV
ncbi:ABC transporter permease [Bacillus sp. CGMCC 1.16607]|uniref:ABC transporter permease n=1 Tax=Bacillus sp. CGMCC 1.16607 TaxID=3351842 RepID=UPI0036435FA7